jgi:hypothetical protein
MNIDRAKTEDALIRVSNFLEFRSLLLFAIAFQYHLSSRRAIIPQIQG